MRNGSMDLKDFCFMCFWLISYSASGMQRHRASVKLELAHSNVGTLLWTRSWKQNCLIFFLELVLKHNPLPFKLFTSMNFRPGNSLLLTSGAVKPWSKRYIWFFLQNTTQVLWLISISVAPAHTQSTLALLQPPWQPPASPLLHWPFFLPPQWSALQGMAQSSLYALKLLPSSSKTLVKLMPFQ